MIARGIGQLARFVLLVHCELCVVCCVLCGACVVFRAQSPTSLHSHKVMYTLIVKNRRQTGHYVYLGWSQG